MSSKSNNNNLLQVRLPYHVRVCVPCYKEDLEILRRTILAAYDALLPAGCSRTIYLCDDGKDPRKRKWSVLFFSHFSVGTSLVMLGLTHVISLEFSLTGLFPLDFSKSFGCAVLRCDAKCTWQLKPSVKMLAALC